MFKNLSTKTKSPCSTEYGKAYDNGVVKDLTLSCLHNPSGVPRSPDSLVIRIFHCLSDEKRVVHFNAVFQQIWCIIYYLLLGATPAARVVDNRLSWQQPKRVPAYPPVAWLLTRISSWSTIPNSHWWGYVTTKIMFIQHWMDLMLYLNWSTL